MKVREMLKRWVHGRYTKALKELGNCECKQVGFWLWDRRSLSCKIRDCFVFFLGCYI